jgi:hypothetical protein
MKSPLTPVGGTREKDLIYEEFKILQCNMNEMPDDGFLHHAINGTDKIQKE